MKTKNNLSIDIAIGVILGLFFIAILNINKHIFVKDIDADRSEHNTNTVIKDVAKSQKYYGFDKDSYYFEEDEVHPGQILGSILYWEGVSFNVIDELAKKAKDVFDVRWIRPGHKLVFVREDSCSELKSLVYEPDKFSYVIFNVKDSIYVKKEVRPVDVKIEFASGEVGTSLWNSMRKNNLSISLIDKMEDALASEVDFYHAKKGDKYKLLFEKKYINGKPVSVGKLLGAYYNNGQEHYGIYFETQDYKGYYNYKGEPTKKAFLRAPVRFSRISSRFSYSRYHPILHRVKAHFGTDYAAPYGTPIMAVAAGTVIRKGYGKGNGNYITIKHDKTYTTTYLHMQRFAKGIEKGVHVNQGDIIGYVGSTGLATGPHVCFRMKKNGKPVNHLKENFPSPEPLPDSILSRFYVVRDSVINILNTMQDQNTNDSILVSIKEKEANANTGQVK